MSGLFNYAEGRKLAAEGMAKASSFPFDTAVGRARNIAVMLAKRHGEVHADMVFQYLQDCLPEVLNELQPNAWGSVFRSPRLKFSGRVRNSEKVSRHSSVQRIWGYNP